MCNNITGVYLLKTYTQYMLLKQQYSDILKTAFDSSCISPNDSIAPASHLMARVYTCIALRSQCGKSYRLAEENTAQFLSDWKMYPQGGR